MHNALLGGVVVPPLGKTPKIRDNKNENFTKNIISNILKLTNKQINHCM